MARAHRRWRRTRGALVIASPGLQRAGHDQLAPRRCWAQLRDGPYLLKFCTRPPLSGIRAHARSWQTLVAALLLLPFAISVDGALPPMNVRGVASLAYVGPIATAFAYWAVVEVGRYVRATTMSVALLAVPSLGLLISALTFLEAVNVSLGLGVVLIVAGVWLTTTEARGY